MAEGADAGSLKYADVKHDLDRYGFAVARASIAATRLMMMSERYRLRTDSSSSATLTPHATQDAPPRSLSAVYGLGEQPLHSDGAHLPSPPDVVVLHSNAPSATSTMVWPLASLFGADALQFGVFTVRGNGITFLASAYENHRIRYDPVVMTPSDSMARKVAEYFVTEREAALQHQWTDPDTLLFIDNRQALHARNAIENDGEARVITRLAYDLPEES